MQAKKPIPAQKQRQNANRGRFEKGNKHAFKPGQSGNPGGLPKGTPKVSIAYMNLLGMSPADRKKFKPATTAEEMALEQVKRALGGAEFETRDSINATEKIIDRVEGKPVHKQEVTGANGQPLFTPAPAFYEAWIQTQMRDFNITREQAIQILSANSVEGRKALEGK
jgi:hypothetical protein